MGRKLIPSDEIDLKTANAPVMFEQGKDSEAEQFLLKQIREAGEDVERYFPYLYYGDLLMRMGKIEDARDILLQSAHISLKQKDDLWLALSHEKLGDLSAAEESWFGALHHYRYSLRMGSSRLERSVMDRLEAKASTARSTLLSTVLTQHTSIIALTKEYVSGNMSISFVHCDIFLKTYFARCLECNFCHDWCCSFGADIDIKNVEKIQQLKEDILPFVRSPEGEWFEAETIYYEEYAGNQYTRINTQGPRCVFISKDQRGCGLHRFAISRQMDYHEIKPLVCILFPLSFEEGILTTAGELDDKSLVCAGAGDSAYRAMRYELEYYFGREFVEELDGIEKEVLAAR